MSYEELLKKAQSENVYVLESVHFESKAKGLINGEVIGLSNKLKTAADKTCVLAEELGHYYTTAGNIMDQTDTANRKQEVRARLWAYDTCIGLEGIIQAYEQGCHSLYETAEYLGVTESFLADAIEKYRAKYGPWVRYNGYLISFVNGVQVGKII